MDRNLWWLLCAAGLLSLPAWAGRPLTIDDADPVVPGAVEIEAGFGLTKEGAGKTWELPLGLAYGICPGLEAGLGLGVQAVDLGNENESGLTDTALGAKWRIIEECPLGARHALAPSVKIPTADEDKDLGSGETDVDLTWIASRRFGEKAGAHLNLGYSWIGGPGRDVLHYGMALDFQATETLQLVGEVFAEQETSGSSDTSTQFNLGLRVGVSEALVLDLAAGTRIGDEGPDFTAAAGLTWTFGDKEN